MAQSVINKDDRLGRGVFFDFRYIKYRVISIAKSYLFNPPITPLTPIIHDNHIVYNIKDFL